jgi:hypothetical protein
MGEFMIRTPLIAAMLAFVACPADAKPREAANTLTHGMVQMTLRVGQTTQMEVLDSFGAPNITTLDGEGREVWVYDRHATVTADSSSGFSIGMLVGAAGSDVGGGGGLGFGKRKSRSSSSTRSMTLIIKFAPDKRVIDFKSRTSSF